MGIKKARMKAGRKGCVGESEGKGGACVVAEKEEEGFMCQKQHVSFPFICAVKLYQNHLAISILFFLSQFFPILTLRNRISHSTYFFTMRYFSNERPITPLSSYLCRTLIGTCAHWIHTSSTSSGQRP